MQAAVAAEVLIVGAGPVGLTAALDLAWRVLPVIVIGDDYDPSGSKGGEHGFHALVVVEHLRLTPFRQGRTAMPAFHPAARADADSDRRSRTPP